jgi:hypothetical protein
MSMFEYLMVMVSIIMGLGMTQTLRGLSKIVRGDKPYLAVSLWASFFIYLYIQNWWAFWDLNTVGAWNQAYFILVISIPCAMFAATELLLPMGATADTDWRAHFFSVRRWFFLVMIVFTTVATMESWLLLGVPLTHPYRVMQGTILALLVVGLLSKHPRIQPWIAGGAFGVLLFGQALFRFVPGLD